uniref:Transcription factor EB n=1 Tax=Salmo trutta TaxID=8032 RepID=A0A674AGD3_SALTR
MYCQLMRDQLQQEEQRERQLQQNAALQYIQQQSMSAPAPSPAINAPQHYQSMQVPVEVLKVQTHLENPTDYHIRQSQRQQVKEYLSTTYATKQVPRVVQPSPPPPHHSPLLRTEQLITGNSAPNSPMAMLNIGSSHENEVHEVLIHTRAHIQSICLPLSSSHLDVYTGPGMTGQSIAMTSNSCPANLAIKRELTETRAMAKERQKKDNHNLSEFIPLPLSCTLFLSHFHPPSQKHNRNECALFQHPSFLLPRTA